MNLAYVSTTERGATDRLLSAAAAHLTAQGVALAGVVQSNTECADSSRCDMDLKVLPDGETIRISQSLGAGSRGCRLDPAGLELAVGLVGRSLEAGPRLMIVNKFGKHEADGRGFRPLIGEALARDIPVLVGLNGLNAERFLEFTDGAAEQLPPEIEAIETWLNRVAPEGTAAA